MWILGLKGLSEISCLRLQSMKKALLLPFFFKVSINHIFDNLESGKRNYCLEKKHEKSLEFWIQESVRALSE